MTDEEYDKIAYAAWANYRASVREADALYEAAKKPAWLAYLEAIAPAEREYQAAIAPHVARREAILEKAWNQWVPDEEVE